MASFINLYVAYREPGEGKEVPLFRDSMVDMFDEYIPGEPGTQPDDRFCELEQVKYDELPDFMREEFPDDSCRMYAEMTWKDFDSANRKAIRRCMRSMVTCLSALGLQVDDENLSGELRVYSGKLDDEGRKNEDYSPLTWPVDKKLVLKYTGRFNDMRVALKASGIARVIRDMVPSEVPDEDIRMILVRH